MTASKAPNISIGDVLDIRRNLKGSPEAYGILLLNILLLVFVLFFETDPYLVVAAYFLETLMIGIFNVIKMLVITFFSPSRHKFPDPKPIFQQSREFSSARGMNIFLIFFFILHFGIFYFVQLTFLSGFAEIGNKGFAGSSSFFPNPFTFFKGTLGEFGNYIFFSILIMQAFSLIYSFILKKEYRVMNCVTQGMQPYSRIIIQQLVVLIGGFFIIIFTDFVILSVLLIIIKTFIDIYAQKRQDSLMSGRMEAAVPKSRVKPE